MSEEDMENLRKVLPKLGADLTKGACGRIAVIGGSEQYAGAPYFAAMTTLRMGADVCHVFAHPSAAAAIKHKSPALVIHPRQEPSYVLERLKNADAVVLGPGLGRQESLLPLVEAVAGYSRDKAVPLVIDADGLFFVSRLRTPELTLGEAVLTPNKREFQRLCETHCGVQGAGEESIMSLALALDTTVVLKGESDRVCTRDGHLLSCSAPGCLRRCGGLGDVLAGAVATGLVWARNACLEPCVGVLAGCEVARAAGRNAFQQVGRGMTAEQVVEEVAAVVRQADKQ